MSVANGWNKGLVFINGYNIVRAGCLECSCLRADCQHGSACSPHGVLLQHHVLCLFWCMIVRAMPPSCQGAHERVEAIGVFWQCLQHMHADRQPMRLRRARTGRPTGRRRRSTSPGRSLRRATMRSSCWRLVAAGARAPRSGSPPRPTSTARPQRRSAARPRRTARASLPRRRRGLRPLASSMAATWSCPRAARSCEPPEGPAGRCGDARRATVRLAGSQQGRHMPGPLVHAEMVGCFLAPRSKAPDQQPTAAGPRRSASRERGRMVPPQPVHTGTLFVG